VEVLLLRKIKSKFTPLLSLHPTKPLNPKNSPPSSLPKNNSSSPSFPRPLLTPRALKTVENSLLAKLEAKTSLLPRLKSEIKILIIHS
jgi:hypothetical protein